ncbi:hypothetical protein LTR37_003991 [Vermiconidia calcicola]|uniref:Uncharacterized protein n=1 Tax=Vermiconidia calcicola TaxID=1690605 RepID=A0ACC3NNX6_9PEZI|nr:hypothetical protein LTR37_003991 [Vermiconidia calcicola]
MDDGERSLQKDSASNMSPSVGPEDEIVYHYLTFETSLPQPAHLAQPLSLETDSRQPPPECPNLKMYTSPFLWSKRRKNLMTWLGCIATTITAYTAGAYAPGIAQMRQEWNISTPAAEVGIAVFTAGFGVAPMFLAPFSEINGRRPVIVATGCLFVLFQLICALTPTFAADRNWAMALFTGGAIFGTGLGPLVSGFIAQYLDWRWIFRLQICTTGVLILVVIVFFKESRGSVLLSRKAKALNKWYDDLESAGYYGFLMPNGSTESLALTEKSDRVTPQRIRWKVRSDEERATVVKTITVSLYRPFHLLFTEPVVFFFSLWITLAWSALYLLFSAVPLVYSTRYGFNTQQCGAVFAAISVGSLIITPISIYQEPLARKYVTNEKYREFLSTPEGRLLFCCVQSTLLPIGCFWFGWTCFSSIPWIVPTLGVACATMGIFSIYLAVFNYLADIYHEYASSALAAQSFCRNMVGGSFPIYTPPLFTTLTYGGAGSFLGAISLLLTVVPWILVFYGPKIRARSKIARELLVEKNAD